MMIMDMHLHTTMAGPHSSLEPEEAIAEAKRIGLNGVCVTEHMWSWEKRHATQLTQEHNFPIFRGIEVATDFGHIGVFGLETYVSGIHKLAELRRVADEVGAFLIALHPFRRAFDPVTGKIVVRPSFEEAATWPVFQYVDEIEALNGASSDIENEYGLQVCRILGKKGTAGSDAHSTQGLGCCITVFERDIFTEEELLVELRAGRFRPAARLSSGELLYYGPEDAKLENPDLSDEVEGEPAR